jgi:hypothetical protein
MQSIPKQPRSVPASKLRAHLEELAITFHVVIDHRAPAPPDNDFRFPARLVPREGIWHGRPNETAEETFEGEGVPPIFVMPETKTRKDYYEALFDFGELHAERWRLRTGRPADRER